MVAVGQRQNPSWCFAVRSTILNPASLRLRTHCSASSSEGLKSAGSNGKKQVYDWDAFYKTIQRLQPKAVMAIMGDDVRWVGNEKGLGRETEANICWR